MRWWLRGDVVVAKSKFAAGIRAFARVPAAEPTLLSESVGG